MSKVWGKRPSPSLVISVLALFVALGGSAYAATKIGTKNIKNNAVTSAKIKKNAVTTAKIKNGAVTGAKINAATLGTVPNATHAATADKATTADTATKATDATNATNAVNAANFGRYFTSGVVKASPGQNPTILTIGPFTITGHCEETGTDEYEAFTTLTTSDIGSSMSAYEDNYYEADFEPGEEVELSYAVASSEPETSEYQGYYSYDDFMAASGSGGTLLDGSAVNAVHYFGSPCAFWASATNGG